MAKYEYWLQYQSLDFHAEIFKAESGLSAEDINYDFSGEISGPFKTLKEARAEGLYKVNNDLQAFKGMKRSILSKPTEL